MPRLPHIVTVWALLAVAIPAAHAEVGDDEIAEFNELGQILANDAHYDRALVYFTRALNRASENERWILVNNSANVYLLLEDFEQAVELYERALSDPNATPHVHLNLGLLYQASGDVERSYRHFAEGAEGLGGVEEVKLALGLAGGSAPVDGPKQDAADDASRSQIEAILRRIERGEPASTTGQDDAYVSDKGFQGANLTPFRPLWIDIE